MICVMASPYQILCGSSNTFGQNIQRTFSRRTKCLALSAPLLLPLFITRQDVKTEEIFLTGILDLKPKLNQGKICIVLLQQKSAQQQTCPSGSRYHKHFALLDSTRVGQRPRSYLSCCSCCIFRLIYTQSTPTTVLPLCLLTYVYILSYLCQPAYIHLPISI